MMSKLSSKLLLAALVATGLSSARFAGAQDHASDKAAALEVGKVEETETKSQLGEPNFGYVGQLGSFTATKGDGSRAMLVVHNDPDTENVALGRTRLTFVGAKRLGNVDGWVYKTEWDGTNYPSQIFFSSEKVYFGGGVNAYIAADHREKTGWAWKMLPLRRMQLVTNSHTTQ